MGTGFWWGGEGEFLSSLFSMCCCLFVRGGKGCCLSGMNSGVWYFADILELNRPHLVYDNLHMPPTHQGWREHTFAAPGREEGAGNVTVWRISFDCSQGATCEFGGRCHEEL